MSDATTQRLSGVPGSHHGLMPLVAVDKQGDVQGRAYVGWTEVLQKLETEESKPYALRERGTYVVVLLLAIGKDVRAEKTGTFYQPHRAIALPVDAVRFIADELPKLCEEVTP